ncbi:aldo/keto reductase [Cyclobacterium jeungdonense]|uniref:Aldo/keto reductase n=1 Tax=Cyclobacterium jeungdonense TaxID=708087 RepID=A0ABT8C186_9BACT|nr:aldo/keto reductase [Cyclobacterium jeungdonense]MDN3686544.1 aldo/keto reductase [Cyclobacterium jeungdonense]
MNYRKLGKTNLKISEVSLGTWQVGGGWGGSFDSKAANRIINEAIDQGVNFIDTADVYDAGLSEAAVGKALRERNEEVYIATKCGRQVQPHVSEGYTPEILRGYVEASLKNLGLETIDLIQLHCPPSPVYQRDEIFGLFEDLKHEGKIRNMGVSVEKVDEALQAMSYPNVTSVQIIFNMFRQKPLDHFFEQAKKNDCGVIVRVPLASGLLSGKITEQTSFHPEDHRHFNRNGEAFDKGETFSGIPLEKGVKAVEELKKIFGEREALASLAIRWVLMFDAVSTVIPGASKLEQVRSNVAAAGLPGFEKEEMKAVEALYEKYFKAQIHPQW